MSIFIIAKIGINHNGDLDICKELIDTAVDCGCDAVKFQKRSIDKVYTQEYLNSRMVHGEPLSVIKRRVWSLASTNIK